MSELRIVIVGFPSVQILDVTGPLEVFSTASRFLPIARYATELVSTDGGPVLSTSGLEFATGPIDAVVGNIDTLVVAGGRDMEEAAGDPRLVDSIRRLALVSRRVASVCSGAFLLAAAGLLDGRRATTHWAECEVLGRAYPEVMVDPDAIYVQDGNVWTSAGVTAGIDLALAFVADDHGRKAAATVARRLVVYLRRSGGQAQFSALLAAQSANDEPIRDVLAWLPDNLTADLSISGMATRAHLSERQFSRVFKSEVGITPAEHVEAVRMEAACSLLETTMLTVEEIARACGFGTPETMNRAFRRRLNTTPTNHRDHFGSD
ncbi:MULTISPECIES: GlxA family transcriptional regulator [unclassified Cryobacterium]|uniref:GlxA family transcriptional regulator n=1 Tax=unclassified Cryobacterium TaxID=2649013 RepID=UPI002AB5CB5A|nr:MULTISPECIES: GlxA family transcriptional regulator [unclassified Cryobacterium]MDY7526395.1 GlxA family transcriptional regulator [Cryobacterium sp. 10C2]MDY7557801.1 GlxA family transcriptional regulator [Cryobacterium sp. 10C3]MEB0292179.1 GlxA family transcriptional regulator [Cryobacterium sp. 10C2]